MADLGRTNIFGDLDLKNNNLKQVLKINDTLTADLETQAGAQAKADAAEAAAKTYAEPSLTAGSASQYYRGDKTWQSLNSTAVGLGSVDNKSSATIRSEITSANVTSALGFTPEQAFTKNTGFNKAFGTGADNVAQGNHTHDSRYYTKTNLQGSGTAQVHYNNLTNVPTSFTPSDHTHDTSDLTGIGTAASKDVGTASGQVPLLGAGGKLDTAVLPALAITDTYVVSSQTAMLGLTAQTGDVAVRTDLKKSFILAANDPTTLANWEELLTPSDAVLSVNGKTGTVTLGASDVGAEPAFTKNSAFNKNFGTTSGTVAQGNHTHSYLPLTGGDLSGELRFTSSLQGIRFHNDAWNDAGGLRYQYTNNDGYMEFWTSDDYSEYFVFNAYDVGMDGSGTKQEWFKINGTAAYHNGTALSKEGHTHNYESPLTFSAIGSASVSRSGNTITIGATDTNTTYSAGSGINLSGTTFSHADTSTQGSVDNSGGTVIQDVTLDGYGHVTGLVSYNLDSRYYTETEADARFLRGDTSDTLSGTLTVTGNINMNGLQLGFGNDSNAIVVNDSNNEARSGYYSSADSFTLQMDGSPTNTVVKTGHIDVTNVYTSEKVGVNKFSMEYNATEDSLDFVYTA